MDNTRVPSMLTSRRDFAVGISGSCIIAAGGHTDSRSLNTVEILDMQNQIWKQVTSMNEERFGHGGAIISCSATSFHMVIAGGAGNHGCAVYSFKNDSWSTLPDLKFMSWSRQLIAIDGMLIAGGETNLETLDLLSTPELIYDLMHFAVELDLFQVCAEKRL